MTLNRCDFIGNLGQDVEMRYTQAGDPVASMSIACTERWKDKQGQQQENTEWVRVTAFGKLAELCGNYLHKGSKIYLSGKMKTDKYQDQAGVTKYSTGIIAREVKFLDSKPAGDNYQQQNNQPPHGNGQQNQPPQQQSFSGGTGEDVPF